MAGIGDSWGTAQELMHPRDAHGRFRSKWKMSPGVLAAVEKVLTAFRPRTFQSDSQAAQYNLNLANARKPKRFGGGKGFARLQADYHAADEDLRDGNIDEPSTRKFVQMMDEAMIDLPDDVIVSRVVGPDAFGLTPERLPELEEMTGNVIADRGYGAANIGTPLGGGQGMITMIHAVPKGTKMAIPGRNANDRAMFFDRDQEFTVSKVKPDGRGGYNMFVVATPKTAGETPQVQGVGHQGVGTSHNREAAIKELQNAATKREMGQQPAGALPSQPSEPQSARAARNAAPHVPGTAQPQAGEDANSRAARRSRILGRPTGANATPEAQQAAPASAAPTPAAVPNAPAAVPNGATSVVTGNPATSFREAATGLESPSAGPRRREWNSAYQGVVSGKQHPQDMLRELEADIASNKKLQGTPAGQADSQLGADIEKQEKLADLIRSHFTLGEPVQRQSRQDVQKEIQAKSAKEQAARGVKFGGSERPAAGKKTATEKAVVGPMSKVAPKRTDGTPASRAQALGDQAAKDHADDVLNAEQRTRWASEVGKEPATGLGPKDASGILLDETADLLRNGRVTRPKAAERLREQGRDIDTPAADYLRKVADAIEADTSKPNKRVPLKKRVPKAAPDVAEAKKKLEGRTEKNILTGLNGLSVGELRALGDEWGVETRGGDKKLKLKAALAKELAAKWKATPDLQGKKPEAPATVVEKKVAKAAVKAAVKKAVPAKAALPEQPKTPAAKALTKIAEAPEAPPVLAKAAKKALRKDMTKAERDANLPELSSRVLAGESAHNVVNDIRARLGVQPEPRVTMPGPIETSDLKKNTVRQLRAMADDLGVNPPARAKKQELLDLIEARRTTPGQEGAPAAPEVPKVSGVDTAERARLQARAKEVLAELNNGPAADPFDQMAKELKQQPGGQHADDLVKMAKEIRDEVQATSGPSGVSVEDRVAARMLARVKPEYRDSILAEMPEKDRKHLMDVAEKVAREDARVKVSGHDLDKIMADSGFKAPTSGESLLDYDGIKALLAQNKVDKAKEEVRRLIRGTDGNLRSFREGLARPDQTQANKEWLGKQITKELARADWLASVGRALDGGDSPELVTRKKAQQVIPIHLTAEQHKAFTPENLKAFADQQGIKLPEGATSRDQILTEISRESIRRDLAGKPLKAPEPVKLAAKKAAPKVEHVRIDARTLVPDIDESKDKKILDRVQGLLDGNPDDIANAGLPRGNPTPAAVGRYLDQQVNGIGTQRAMGSLTLNNARQRLAADPGNADYWNPIIAEHEATQKSLQDQMDRLKALAEKLKKTRRTPVKKAAAPEAPSTPPIKETLARAAKSAPVPQTARERANASITSEIKDLRAARDRKKLADEEFRRAEAKVANLDPELDTPQADQWENELEAARNERDAADDAVKAALEGAKTPSAASTEKKVAERVARKEVQAEVAKKATAAPAKKAAKKAAPTTADSSGEKKYTNDELQNMSLGDLVQIENDRDIKRVSVAKQDRIKAILAQQEEGGAEKKAVSGRGLGEVNPELAPGKFPAAPVTAHIEPDDPSKPILEQTDHIRLESADGHKFSEAHAQALYDYANEAGGSTPWGFREKKLSPEAEKNRKLIDDIMEHSKLTEDSKVWRGIQNPQRVFGDRIKKNMTGEDFTDHGFTSTSPKRAVSEEYLGPESLMLQLDVPKGAGGVFIPGEHDELLLDRDLPMKVISDTGPDSKPRLIRIKVSKDKVPKAT